MGVGVAIRGVAVCTAAGLLACASLSPMSSDRRDVLEELIKQAAREPYEGCAALQREVSSGQHGGGEKDYLEAGKKAVCACGGEDGRPLPDVNKLTHAQQAEVATSHRYPLALTTQAARALLDWVPVATNREELRSVRSTWKAHKEPCQISIGQGYLSRSFFSDRLLFQWQTTEDNVNKRLSALDEQDLNRKDAEQQQAWDKRQEQVKAQSERQDKQRLAAARRTPRYWGSVLSEQVDDLVRALTEVQAMVGKGFTTLARDRYFPVVVSAENKLCQRIDGMKAALSPEQVHNAVADAHKRTAYASGDKEGAAMLTLLNSYVERSPADCRYLAKSGTFARQ